MRQMMTAMRICLLAWGGVCAVGQAGQAQQALQIKDLLADPAAYRGLSIVVHGRVDMPGEMRGINASGQQLCGQEFTLHDDTGHLLMRHIVVCQGSADGGWRVTHGETVTIEATLDHTFGPMALATLVRHDREASPQVHLDSRP